MRFEILHNFFHFFSIFSIFLNFFFHSLQFHFNFSFNFFSFFLLLFGVKFPLFKCDALFTYILFMKWSCKRDMCAACTLHVICVWQNRFLLWFRFKQIQCLYWTLFVFLYFFLLNKSGKWVINIRLYNQPMV